VRLHGGLGRAPQGLPEARRAITMLPDDFEHEQATCHHVKDRGRVVLKCCGHRCVVDSVRTERKVSGVNKVHAFLGGLHLAPHPVDRERQTLAEPKAIEPDLLVCSAEAFNAMIQREMPDRFVRSSTGTRFVFRA
jgi:7,8-dihydropterin-6-yl-methyl-4-(beta-D-ribofuranosyl)aminobenzene 5'-phosphate synthase